MRTLSGCLLLAGLLTGAGCGSSTDSGDPEELTPGSIVGTIDGSAWNTTTAIAVNAGGRIVVAGTGTQSLTFGFGVTATTPGSYAVGGAGNASASLADGTGSVWEAAVTGGGGTLTITKAASNQIEGTFSFTLVRTLGSSTISTRTITNGRFNLRY